MGRMRRIGEKGSDQAPGFERGEVCLPGLRGGTDSSELCDYRVWHMLEVVRKHL